MNFKRVCTCFFVTLLSLELVSCGIVTDESAESGSGSIMTNQTVSETSAMIADETRPALDPAFAGSWQCDYVTTGIDLLYEKATYLKLKEDNRGILCLNGKKTKIRWKKTENGFRIKGGDLSFFTFTDDGMCYTSSGGSDIYFARSSGSGRYKGRWNAETVTLPGEYAIGDFKLNLDADSSAELNYGTEISASGSCQVTPEGIVLDLDNGSQWIFDFEDDDTLSCEMEEYILHLTRTE